MKWRIEYIIPIEDRRVLEQLETVADFAESGNKILR